MKAAQLPATIEQRQIRHLLESQTRRLESGLQFGVSGAHGLETSGQHMGKSNQDIYKFGRLSAQILAIR
jgi:hypothetical protein